MTNNAPARIEQALAVLQRRTGISVDYDPDARTLHLTSDTFAVTLQVHTVDAVTPATLAALMQQTREPGTVIIAPPLTPEQAGLLREAGVNYLDAAGNAHLRTPAMIALIEGKQPKSSPTAEQHVGRAFQAAGLKVVFTLLVDPARVDASYRTLADRVGVSLGTVKYALDDLERRGNVIKIGRGRGMRRRLTDVADLARRWADSYGDHLRPKLLRGRYRFLDPDRQRRWKSLDLDAATTCWSGEPAADLYGGHLRADRLTLYTTTATADLARALRIVPANDGPIDVLDRFWTDDVEMVDGRPVVPRILAYADLLASRQARNLEAAQPLFDAWADAARDPQ